MLRLLFPLLLITLIVIAVAGYDLETRSFSLVLAVENILLAAVAIYRFIAQSDHPTLIVTMMIGVTLFAVRVVSITSTGR